MPQSGFMTDAAMVSTKGAVVSPLWQAAIASIVFPLLDVMLVVAPAIANLIGVHLLDNCKTKVI